MSSQNEFILNGFNVDDIVNEKMFEVAAPRSLIMPVCFLTPPGADKTNAFAAIELVEGNIDEIARQCAQGPMLKLVAELPDYFAFGVGELQPAIWNVMPDSGKEWMTNGVFVEAGYHNPQIAVSHDPFREVLNAMMLYDLSVDESGSVNPADHAPLHVGKTFAEEWAKAVGNLFGSGAGVWCREILEHRNMILIICRALMTGRDPVVEYQRFVDAGGKYFLEYPMLCP